MSVRFRQSISRIELSVPCSPQTDHRALSEALDGLKFDDIHIIQDPRLRTHSSRHFELRSYSEEHHGKISAYEEYRIRSVVQDLNDEADTIARRSKRRVPKIVMKVHEADDDEDDDLE